MKKSQRLKVVIELHERQEHEALQAFGRQQQKVQEAQRQLDHLQSYRIEYGNKLLERQKQGMNVDQLLELRAFADKLDKAIDGQRHGLLTQERELQRLREIWEQAHQRCKSLHKLRELALQEEQKLENRREQAEQDDRAARMARKDGMGRA